MPLSLQQCRVLYIVPWHGTVQGRIYTFCANVCVSVCLCLCVSVSVCICICVSVCVCHDHSHPHVQRNVWKISRQRAPLLSLCFRSALSSHNMPCLVMIIMMSMRMMMKFKMVMVKNASWHPYPNSHNVPIVAT